MMKEKIYNLMINFNIKIEKDIYDYGINIFTTYLKYLVFIIPLSFLLQETTEVFIFIVLFIPIRRFIGGFHFNNLNYCFVSSVVSALLLPYLALHIKFPTHLVFIIIMLTFLLTMYIGAVDHPNKQLTDTERKKHTRKVILIELIYVNFIFMSKIIDNNYISNMIIVIFIFCIGGLCISKKQKK